MAASFTNPFRPGAGHIPPYLAGRDQEKEQFRALLKQRVILKNLILTGLRGVGKTVLLTTFKPAAMEAGWKWVGTDLSEASSVSETTLAQRLLTDLSVFTSSLTIRRELVLDMGFVPQHKTVPQRVDYDYLWSLYERTPGLTADKIKTVLEHVWTLIKEVGVNGLVFAYDEAQNMSDNPDKGQYPLSLLLDVFMSIQKKDIPFMLVLTGLPTLFPKLVETRTYSERMFTVIDLKRLDANASREAIAKPIEDTNCPIKMGAELINKIVAASAGYPYFIQFICKEAYDAALQNLSDGRTPTAPMGEIIRKLDTDFFAGRWAKATDRQRDLLRVIANLDHSDAEFTVQEIVERGKHMLDKPFGASQVNQMLSALGRAGLVYKNRHGRYSFAVPLFGQFILRHTKDQ